MAEVIETREPSYLVPGRKPMDRHGPFAYFCVFVIFAAAVAAPGAIFHVATAIATIYGARAVERGSYRALAAYRAGQQREVDRQDAERLK